MALCTVCNAYQKSFNSYLEAMKYMQGGKRELDGHLKALSDITASREDHIASHAVTETDNATR